MISSTASSTIISALRGSDDYFMTSLEWEVQGAIVRQAFGSWVWGGKVTCWFSYHSDYCLMVSAGKQPKERLIGVSPWTRRTRPSRSS